MAASSPSDPPPTSGTSPPAGHASIDAAGQTVTPGFIDTHCHVSGVGELYSVNANVRRVRELQANLKAKADKTPPGQWVEGIMFDDTKLDVVLTRRFLDEVTRDHPLVVNHRGGHTSWYNSKAFEMAGITKDTPTPTTAASSATSPAITRAGSRSWRATSSTRSARAKPSPPNSNANAAETGCVTSRSC